ncbi:beta-1,4 N-acetylgalactosaminyltransferase 2-like [Boleophthalmus pectinirostris]|uniref:beta-1,4 N-acetylgalactosaminyltransferase 2-like n=1 Tax=Boleophthalmus pectinirostris TaxID=150288 RepID=UPI00242BEF00|nr:beta-1,4 N-acetylgalactosaminyltransferase 2-like [Boleophthalmus pectinirostris]
MSRSTVKVLSGIFMVAVFSLFVLYRLPDLAYRIATSKAENVSSTLQPWLATHSMPASRSCECDPRSVRLKDHIPKEQFDQVSERRKEELEKHKKRTSPELSKLLLAPANSPLQYPIQGVTVPPLKERLIPGLALHAGGRSRYKVTLKVSRGIFSTNTVLFPEEVTVQGNQEANFTVESTSLQLLNSVLASVSYKSTVYHVHTGDLASFSFENHEATFPIVIKRPQLPVLFDMGTDINSQVTITTKTFLRYNNLKVLLSSIRKFYPTVTVIIADDSLEPEKITGDNIQHYIMPPAQGWFAGRNLAVSQVTTKYFLWVDDDFVFTKNTMMEKLVEVMEAAPYLDVVGGSVQGNMFHFSLEYDEGDEAEGGCLTRKSTGKFHALPGYPQCFLSDGVVNFFLARTDSVQKARFDPLLKRVAHSEWFMDGLGSLMVASCAHVQIGHQPKTLTKDYNKYRYPNDASDKTFKLQHHYFKNYLKCIMYG